MIYFRLSADADQFLTIAKFRALRKLWARIEEACGLAPRPVFVAAETAWRMMTQRDPYVNMLRETIAVVAAGVGGADAITVLPFTQAIGLPDRFARRIARNTQLLLLEESNLAKVADPAAGSGGIEDLTEQLCRAAWTLFQEIEQAGGAFAALEAGLIQKKVAAVRAEREAAVARRKDALTGTSDFPDLAEALAPVLDVPPVTPLPIPRSSSSSRSRRSGSPNRSRRCAMRPIACWPRPARGRKSFSPIWAASPISPRARPSPRTSSRPAASRRSPMTASRAATTMIAAFKSSGAKLACLCSSDEVYPAEAIAAAKALAAAGAHYLYLAGRPGEREPELKAAGAQSFIFTGCDVLATLRAAHDILGIATSAGGRR